MTLFSEPEERPPTSRRLAYGLIVLTLMAGAGFFLVSRFQTPPLNVAPASEAPSAPTPLPAPVVPPEPEEVTADSPAPPPVTAPEPPPEPTPPSAPPQVVLRITSDVEGADVFIDRSYAGTTPFESDTIQPGRYHINVSAPGYDGHAEEVEITDELATLSILFRQVRLDESVSAVHKHRFGDCEGQLIANTDGIHYETDHNDAFEVSLDAMEEFSVDYLEHNLRIKVRDGRTYNFTDHQENTDALFVFHREVEKARERLAHSTEPES